MLFATLGSVCGAWRNLTLSMPSLWSRVSVDLDQASASRCALLERWLARSGDHLLSIRLIGHHDMPQESLTFVDLTGMTLPLIALLLLPDA